jgi:hypothetical protein
MYPPQVRDGSYRDSSSKGRIIQVTHRPKDVSSKGRIVQGTHWPRDATSKGRNVQEHPCSVKQKLRTMAKLTAAKPKDSNCGICGRKRGMYGRRRTRDELGEGRRGMLGTRDEIGGYGYAIAVGFRSCLLLLDTSSVFQRAISFQSI